MSGQLLNYEKILVQEVKANRATNATNADMPMKINTFEKVRLQQQAAQAFLCQISTLEKTLKMAVEHEIGLCGLL